MHLAFPITAGRHTSVLQLYRSAADHKQRS
jgi:hypothetical protein